MPQQESLQFSINGDFITKLALEQLYKCNNLPYAIELLRACIKSESMTEAETLQTIIDILNGKAAITGVYPTESYRIVPATPKKGQSILEWVKQREDRIQSLEKENHTLTQQMLCINETLDNRQKLNINSIWQDDYGEEGNIFTLDDTYLTDEFDTIPDYMQLSPEVKDFLDRYTSDDDISNDYGWLEPDGTFHALEWGEHQIWAYNYLKEQNKITDTFEGNEGDILYKQGWVLLHNPSLGTAQPTFNPAHRLTKAQREFLFNYYTDRHKPDLAHQYFNED